jgi:alkylation response protein AidB-like acyl-CoA dehydrogenase
MSSAVAVPDSEDQQALAGAVGGLLARQWGTGAAERAPCGQQAQHDYLMSRSATIAGGTTEIMRNILAERVLGMPR